MSQNFIKALWLYSAKSYEYTKKYRDFCKMMKAKEKKKWRFYYERKENF